MSERDLDPDAELASLRAALAVERAKGEGYAHLSHELRTLVSGITGITGLLLETDLNTEQRDYGKRLRGLCDSLGDLLNTVLDWSRVEAGKLPLSAADLDVRRVVEEVGDLLAERAESKGIELVVAVAGDVPAALRGDAVRLRQVIVNLVSNALKFTERGEVVVRAMLSASSADDVTVRFEVNDTGIGISAEKQARLFQPFSQVHEGSEHGGSGLGLALARQIVQAMGGAIGVESAEGKGARFYFTARFERRDRSVYGLRARRTEDAIPRVDMAGRRVLAAVPNAAVRTGMGDMIDVLGVEHAAAPHGEGAIAMLREAVRAGRAFDVVLIDVALPGVLDLFHAIDTDAAFAALPVVLLAYPGQRLPEDERARPRGDDPRSSPRGTMRAVLRPVGNLGKPVRRAQLFACLRTMMGGAVDIADAAPESRRGGPGSRPLSHRDAMPESRRGAPGSRPLAYRDAVPESRRGGPGSRPHPPRDEVRGTEIVTSGPASSRPRAGIAFAPSAPMIAEAPIERPLILLVEDNAVNQRVGKVMIEKRGYRVDVASDGHEAVAATARATYAAVLMDCQMPRLDGYAATREIRARDEGKPRLPIVAMTANAGPGARERCLAAGMDDYVAKPVTAERIDEILRRWAPLPGTEPETPEPPKRQPSSPVIDLGMLRTLRATQRPGEGDIVAEVVALFLQDVPGRMSVIREAIAGGDLVTAARTVHTLKGSAGHFGAKTLVAMCSRFEDKVRAGTAFNALFAVEAIAAELDRVVRALSREAEELG
ncbi:sensory box histidine kinase/response regulator [Minicystis rosea]|nr:sensory box histidine kinase/response regulator [Minicystis rosea]